MSEAANSVTISKADLKSILNDLEDAEDRCVFLEHALAKATNALPEALTMELVDRLMVVGK